MTDRGRLQNYYKMTIGEKIIDCKIIMKEIGPIAEINCTIETGTTPKNTKETIHTVETGHGSVMVQIGPTVKTDTEIGHTLEIGHIVEIGCEATTIKMTIEMSIGITVRRKIIGILKTRDMREGLKTIIKTGTARIIIEIVTKNKNKYQNKDQYKNDSYDKTSRSKEKDYLYDEDDIFHSKIEKVHKILQTMSQEKEMPIGFILAFSENPDKIINSICSPADVDHLIAEIIKCGKSKKVKNLKTKDPHVNISNTSSQNYESMNVDTDLIQDPINTVSEFIEGEVQIQNIVDSHDEIGLWELEQIPHTTVKLIEGQVLEEFLLEEEVELQGIDNVKW